MFGAIMASSVKYLSDDLHPITICFYRCLIGLILISPFMIKNNFTALKTRNIKLQLSRSIINIVSMICWFSAIGMMHFEKAAALGFTTPLFTTILAIILLKEKFRFHRTAALLVGFLGIIIIVRLESVADNFLTKISTKEKLKDASNINTVPNSKGT